MLVKTHESSKIIKNRILHGVPGVDIDVIFWWFYLRGIATLAHFLSNIMHYSLEGALLQVGGFWGISDVTVIIGDC